MLHRGRNDQRGNPTGCDCAADWIGGGYIWRMIMIDDDDVDDDADDDNA